MTKTQSSSGVTLPTVNLPMKESADQIYDMIMGQIEPELVTASLPLLKEKYKDETPDQRKERSERHQRAFERYDQEYEKFKSQLDESVHVYRKHALGELEAKEKKQDEQELDVIQASINAA